MNIKLYPSILKILTPAKQSDDNSAKILTSYYTVRLGEIEYLTRREKEISIKLTLESLNGQNFGFPLRPYFSN